MVHFICCMLNTGLQSDETPGLKGRRFRSESAYKIHMFHSFLNLITEMWTCFEDNSWGRSSQQPGSAWKRRTLSRRMALRVINPPHSPFSMTWPSFACVPVLLSQEVALEPIFLQVWIVADSEKITFGEQRGSELTACLVPASERTRFRWCTLFPYMLRPSIWPMKQKCRSTILKSCN